MKFDKFCFNALHIRREIVHTAGEGGGTGQVHYMEGYKLHTISSEWSHPAGGRQASWAGQNSTSESYFCHGSLHHIQILGTDHIFSLYLVIHQNNSGGESRSHVLTWNISQSSLKLIRIFSFSLHICLTLHAPKCKAMLNVKKVSLYSPIVLDYKMSQGNVRYEVWQMFA